MRVKFNEQGQQRLFLDYVRQKTKLSLRKLAKKENWNYELLKKYHQEKCLISKEIFGKFCKISNIRVNELNIAYLKEYWGQMKGGKSIKKS